MGIFGGTRGSGLRELSPRVELPEVQRRNSRASTEPPGWRRLRSALALGWLAAAAACGPSVQSIYEGNVHFEHCYRLELDLEIAATHRQACWQQWLSSYTYGQPQDRIEYARRRLRAFASGDMSRPAFDVTNIKSDARQFYLVVPAPTSVHASPPPMATLVAPDAGVAPPAVTASSAPERPGDVCTGGCRDTLDTCHSACSDGHGVTARPKNDPCKKCEPDYRSCMRRCFE